eukprot:SAG25_NODE_10523_length_330_cov_1.108225_2_plen_34_part_01
MDNDTQLRQMAARAERERRQQQQALLREQVLPPR